MPLLSWKSEYSVSVKRFDYQHARLFNIINLLYEYNSSPNNEVLLGEKLDELFNYSKYHFAEEELHMASINYPELYTHILIHEALMDDIEKISLFHKYLKDNIPQEFIVFLGDKLLRHVIDEDKGYAGNKFEL